MSSVDELELVLNRAQEVGTLGPHSCEILVKYRARLLAAVRQQALVDMAIDAMAGVSWSRDIKNAPNTISATDGAAVANALTALAGLAAYRAGDSETGRLEQS